ncbi:hypothetical protein [Leucothrix pacifica]|uniref:Uncharacterized protein n=1 Tax=Leucothrix pacifica TaxID=1247513 RepID=A0A317C2H4_9GAMM|nr:hypothetical protein [Leucothrix pacifica]PWQ92539.1 hypothetical protein DKW60_20665 [Leucothrix pacifica]
MAFRYYKPADRIAKLNEHFQLLNSLFHYEKGFTETEFLHRIESTKGTNSPDSGFTFQQLLNYRLIVESNDYEPRYSLALPYREFLEYLYQESQPVNSAVIQGYIGALDQRIQDLIRAYDDESEALTLRFLKRLGREIDNIGQTSSRNRLGVVSEVRKLKLNDEKLSYKERLSESNRLWDEYLEPLREMISPSGSFGMIMERLKQTLEIGEAKFNGQTELRQLFLQSRARRVQLNEQTRLDLNEAQQELMPLREKLAQESRLMDAAAVIFGHIEQGKVSELPAFPFGRILRRERHIGLSGLRGYLAELWSLETEPDSILQDDTETTESAPLETEGVIALLDEMPENTDVIHYFLQKHQGLSANEVLRAVSIVCLHQQNHNVVISDDLVDYQIDGQVWQGIRIFKGEASTDE